MPGPQFWPTQIKTWKACGLCTHCKRHATGPWLPMQPKKQVTSSMQSPLPKQSSTSLQQFCAMQSLHSDPSDGHSVNPQVPPMQSPLQHSGSLPHIAPSG